MSETSESAGKPSSEQANEGKSLTSTVDGASYERVPIKTHVVVLGDQIDDIITTYALPVVRAGDWLFVTEKIVAITQGRSYPVESIKPRKLATLLSKYVTKTSYGIGLGMPETMEMALREVGTPRILLASAVSVVGKAFRRTGDFYRVAGAKARGIDGPTHNTIPPYNTHVVLVPERPREVAHELRGLLPAGVQVLIVDINDLGGNILGSTVSKADEALAVKILKDNPLGQGHQSTPMGVIRKSV